MKYGRPAAITLFIAAAVALASTLTTLDTTLDAASASATANGGAISGVQQADTDTSGAFTGQSMPQALSFSDSRGLARFDTSLSFNAGGGLISWLAAGDFNGDGKADTAVTSGDGAWILLGQGDGSLGSAVSYSTGAGTAPNQLATADFNGDAKLDVVTANTGTKDVSLLPGNGDGTFQSPLKFATGAPAGTPKFVAIADFNGDGKLDVAAAGSVTASSGFVSVLPGNGDGTFQTSVTTTLGDVDFMTVGDFNGDGKQDLITVSQTDGVSILLGNGNGSFGPAALVYPGSISTHAAAGDFNGDGNLDLAVAESADAGGVTVLLGHGNGTFVPTSNPGGYPFSVAAGDFNGDGKLDLAAAGGDPFSPTELTIRTGNGNGTFSPGVNYTTGGDRTRSLVTGDFDGNGKLDVVMGNIRSADATVVLNKGDGTFRVAPTSQVGLSPQSVTAGDFNRDGKPDLVSVNRDSKDVSVLIGNADGTFKPAVNYLLLLSNPNAITAADFNADGNQDLAVMAIRDTGFDHDVGILLGNGDGSFQTAMTFFGGPADALAARDFNGDGKLDLAIPDKLRNKLSIFLGNGNGSFQPALIYPTGERPISLAVADFNGDGKLDVATGNYFSFDISMLLGNGDGTFQNAVTLPYGRPPADIRAGDFNGDGMQDLSILQIADDQVSILLGNGDGSFKPKVNYSIFIGTAASVTVASTLAGDFNGDGKPDIAVSDSNSNQVLILDGLGDGTFSLSPVKSGTAENPKAMAAADFNGDGRPDIAAVNFLVNDGIPTNGFVSILLNTTPRSLLEADIEDDDHRIDYSDGWHQVAHPSASDGHFGMNSSQSPQHHATLAFDVHGDSGSITYHYATSPKGGSADIYLDGVRMGSISYMGTQGTLRSPAFGQSVTFNMLGQGTHTLELRAINGSVYLDKFTLVSAASNAQPASGPGQTNHWQGTLGIGQDLFHQLDVGTGVSDISLVAEASGGIPVQLVLTGPSGSILSQAYSSNGVAVINHPITRTGLYQLKVVNFGLGRTSVWAAATPLMAR